MENIGDLIFSQKDAPQTFSEYLKFQEILEFVSHQLVASSTIFSEPPIYPKENSVPVL